MPSVWDLPTEVRPKFEEIREVVKSRIGFFSGFHESELVKLFKAHGHEKTLFVVERCMANDWLKPDRYAMLMDVVEKFGMEKTLEAIKALNKLENHSIAMVENICMNPSLAKRKAPGAQNEPPPRQFIAYPTKEGLYDARAAQKWLNEKKGIGFEHAFEYFDKAGIDDFGKTLVTLKPEYK
jgi:hypothetical protein